MSETQPPEVPAPAPDAIEKVVDQAHEQVRAAMAEIPGHHPTPTWEHFHAAIRALVRFIVRGPRDVETNDGGDDEMPEHEPALPPPDSADAPAT